MSSFFLSESAETKVMMTLKNAVIHLCAKDEKLGRPGGSTCGAGARVQPGPFAAEILQKSVKDEKLN